MFGHQDDQSDQNTNSDQAMDTQNDNPGTQPSENSDTNIAIPAPTLKPISTDGSDDSDSNQVSSRPPDVLSPAGGYPLAPSEKTHTLAMIDDPVEEKEEEEEVKSEEQPEDASSSKDDLLDFGQLGNSDLASIKIQALDELYPLIDKLDLSPDEKFKTLMMMIQASDNKELVKSAYEAAHSMTDEKAKAQALLDIVNEINYFTQQPSV